MTVNFRHFIKWLKLQGNTIKVLNDLNMFKSNFKVLILNKCCFLFKFISIKMTEMG